MCLQKRQMLAERAVENAREVEKAYGADVDDGKSHSFTLFIYATDVSHSQRTNGTAWEGLLAAGKGKAELKIERKNMKTKNS